MPGDGHMIPDVAKAAADAGFKGDGWERFEVSYSRCAQPEERLTVDELMMLAQLGGYTRAEAARMILDANPSVPSDVWEGDAAATKENWND